MRIDRATYLKELKRLRESGVPPVLAKRAATEAAKERQVLPEHMNKLGLEWFITAKR